LGCLYMAVLSPLVRITPLKKGDYVYFTENWKPEDIFAGKYFLVKGTLFKIFDKSFVVASGSYYDFVIDDDSGLLPTSSSSLYEIFVGMKGNSLVYILWPETDYMIRLEKTGFTPNTADSTKRYIGFFEPEDTPIAAPRLVIYTTRDMDHVALRFYNDTDEPQKVVIRFNINHCKLEETPAPPAGIEARVIRHWRDIRELGL